MRFLLLIFLMIIVLQGASFQAYTENMPPYNYEINKKVKGFSTHKLKEILQLSGHKLKEKIIVQPWTTSYQIVSTKPNTILYSMARSASREKDFAWVGPIDTMHVGLLAKKNKKIKIKSKSDLNKYTIATLPSSMAENELLKEGVLVKNLDRFSLITSQLKKLRDDRVDAVAFSIPGMLHIMKSLKMDPENYEMVYLIKEVDLYFAFSKNTETSIVEELNSALKDIKSLQHHSN